MTEHVWPCRGSRRKLKSIFSWLEGVPGSKEKSQKEGREDQSSIVPLKGGNIGHLDSLYREYREYIGAFKGILNAV